MKNKKFNQVKIRSLKLSDLKEYQFFISKFWKKDHIFIKNKNFFLWQHSFNKKKINCVSVFYKKKILGSQNYIDFKQFDEDLSKKQIFLGLWSAPTNSNFVGLGFLIYKEIIKKEKPDFIGTIGFNSKTINFHKWQNFKLGKMNHHAFISPYIKKFKIAKIVDKSMIHKISSVRDVKFYETDKNTLTDLNINKLFKYQTPLKSKKYLINRYLIHPVFKYKIFYHKEGNSIPCLFVLREVVNQNAKILKIVDFIGQNKYFYKIKYLLNKLFKKHNYEYASIYSTGIPNYIFKKANFFSIDESSKNIIPNYFKPFVKKNISINYGYKSEKMNNIRFFCADCDQDSPN